MTIVKSLDIQYRWLIITLAFFTTVFAVTIPISCMPVMFKEISNDLDLNLVELGTIWGMAGLAGIFTTLIGGLIGDKYGTKQTLSVFCFLAGIIGASRGLSTSFVGLATSTFLFGFLTRSLAVNFHKTAGVWFAGEKVVIANGIISTGFGLGFAAGAMFSDTFMSPWLGGWENVLFFYGGVTLVFGIIWCLTRRDPVEVEKAKAGAAEPFLQALRRVARVRTVWFLALAQMCYTGCVMGFMGYLPLYLRGIGWSARSADAALAACSAAGMVGAIPLTLLSSRLGSRKAVLVPAMMLTMVAVALLSAVDGLWVWPIVISVGFVRDGYYAIIATTIIETKGIGAEYMGSAAGIVWSLGALGSFISPPLGNSLAGFGQSLPFALWGGLAIIPLIIFLKT